MWRTTTILLALVATLVVGVSPVSARDTWPENAFTGQWSDQCTAFVAERINHVTGTWAAIDGDARLWADNARRHGWEVSTEPRNGSVMVMQPGLWQMRDTQGWYVATVGTRGHVAWVEQIDNATTVTALDRNANRGSAGTDGKRQIVYAGTSAEFIYVNP